MFLGRSLALASERTMEKWKMLALLQPPPRPKQDKTSCTSSQHLTLYPLTIHIYCTLNMVRIWLYSAPIPAISAPVAPASLYNTSPPATCTLHFLHIYRSEYWTIMNIFHKTLLTNFRTCTLQNLNIQYTLKIFRPSSFANSKQCEQQSTFLQACLPL